MYAHTCTPTHICECPQSSEERVPDPLEVVSLPTWVLESELGSSLTVVIVPTPHPHPRPGSSLQPHDSFKNVFYALNVKAFSFYIITIGLPFVYRVYLSFCWLFLLSLLLFDRLHFQTSSSSPDILSYPWSIGETFTDFVFLVPGIGDWLSFSISVCWVPLSYLASFYLFQSTVFSIRNLFSSNFFWVPCLGFHLTHSH